MSVPLHAMLGKSGISANDPIADIRRIKQIGSMGNEREQDREVVKWSLGVWLACVAQALVMVFTSQFDYEPTMMIWRVSNLLILIGCFCFWRWSQGRPVLRSFIFALGASSLIVIGMSLIPTGVTEWG